MASITEHWTVSEFDLNFQFKRTLKIENQPFWPQLHLD